jgi:hypothetical protein
MSLIPPSGQVSVAASLFVTWLFLMLITMLGTRQSRKTRGRQVTWASPQTLY